MHKNVSGLHPFTKYTIVVCARPERSELYSPPQTIRVTTETDVPGVSPKVRGVRPARGGRGKGSEEKRAGDGVGILAGKVREGKKGKRFACSGRVWVKITTAAQNPD